MRRKWGWLSAATLVALLAVTGVTTWAVRGTVRGQENRLLRERSNEVGLVLKEAVDSLSNQVQTVGGVVEATHGSPSAFTQASAALIDGSKGKDSIALLRREAAGYRVVLANGTALSPGQLLSSTLVPTLSRADATNQMVPTPVMGAGADRTLGFALGPPNSALGTVVYLQVALGTLGPPSAARTSPFDELHVVLYGTSTPVPSQALVTTTSQIPLHGNVRVLQVAVGAATWALQVSAAHPLVGTATANAPWFTAGGGILLALLVTAIVEIETRRRRSALSLYRNEQQVAETLQRSLLPELPSVAGLALAARYVPGSRGQQVGGDWYDVFELDDGRIGIAVGDVLGHDITAAALMSRVQTALRAYAFVGEQPGAVLDRLDRLVTSLQTERLVTVFYGVLGPADEDGARLLLFANAGHPPPLLHDHYGRVRELDEASSMLLGASTAEALHRTQQAVVIPAGSALLLYTDGLIEVPGESLSDLINELKHAIAAVAPSTTADELCDRLIERMGPTKRSDDVAVLLLRLARMGEPTTSAPSGARQTAQTGGNLVG
ncbi:MAG: PP2C family protein-serine/threonine phosphatase [Mycobacteriales bacterium]